MVSPAIRPLLPAETIKKIIFWPTKVSAQMLQRDLFIENLLVQIHFSIVMIRWTGLAPWEFDFLFPGSVTFTFLEILMNHHLQGDLRVGGALLRNPGGEDPKP